MRSFRNRLLLSLLFLSSSVFADGSCWLDTTSDGLFIINCVGSGIIYETVTVEEKVYTYPECTSLKASFEEVINLLEQYRSELGYDISAIDSCLDSIEGSLNSLESSGKLNSSDLATTRLYLISAHNNVDDANQQFSNLDSQINRMSTLVNDINCDTSCSNNPSAGGGGSSGSDSCCNVDFSDILEKLNDAQETRESIEKKVKEISSTCETISNTLGYVTFLLEQGFGSTTNELAMINSFLASITNISPNSSWYTLYNISGSILPRYQRIDALGKVSNVNVGASPLGSYFNPSIRGYYTSLFAQGFISTDALLSLNNYFYRYINYSFAGLTNQVKFLTQSATNYFSFFRSELSVLPVLSDYETYSQDYDNYYDFLTNHYVQVSTGGSLSGNLQYKTNWFSRIETLLASLVFSDSQSVSNSVNVSSAQSDADRLTEGLSNINTSASEHSQVLETSSSSIIQVFTSYCDIFDQAALPSQVTLVSLQNNDQTEDISFGLSSHPEFQLAIDYMRFVTTFCWSVAGILVLWKFLVWASRGFYLACKFVYIVITKTFK